MLVQAKLVQAGEEMFDGIVAEELITKVYAQLAEKFEQQKDHAEATRLYLCGRGFPARMSARDEVGYLVGARLAVKEKAVYVDLSLIGIGSRFWGQEGRNPKVMIKGAPRTWKQKRTWWKPWEVKKLIDEIDLDALLLVVNTDEQMAPKGVMR